MNHIVKDILEQTGNFLMHYGMPRRSGRYPWGSGENPYQHSGDFLSRVKELQKQGKSEKEIAEEMGLSTKQLREYKHIANNERRALLVQTAKGLQAKGYNPSEIARQMGYNNESSIRNLLNEETAIRKNQAQATADFLRDQVDKKGMIDVGKGVELGIPLEQQLGVSKEKLDAALTILSGEGYEVYSGGVPQVTNPGQQTIIRVLCPPGTPHKDIYNYENVHEIDAFESHDGGDTFDPKWVYPKSMDSSRLAIRYAEDGGTDKDGVIELRRGVEDLDLGDSRYAQVRILVDDTHYLKGMALYSDDMPEGVDVLFNTNKTKDKSKLEVLKPISTKDPDNPFGSLIKEGIVDPKDPSKKLGGQSYYYDKDGNKQLSLINKRSEEGDWREWSDTLSSQFLAKQSDELIQKQLRLTYADKAAEFDEICSLTNPTVKRKLLDTFASECDSAADHLKAAALPRQKYQVILPLTNIKDNEVYAPNYRDGETVALVRFPHGGTFEIPILKVNNKLEEGKRVLGTNPIDAIGINGKVAQKLSGADFDGDTVLVLPCNSSQSKVRINARDSLAGLADFDPKMRYPEREGMRYMKNPKTGKDSTQIEMGKVSNLIADMTLKGATDEELARAVRHSMVVIDAAKHKLDYKQSEIDNGIASLKKKYQGRYDENGKYHEGASTLITRAKSEVDVPKRRGAPIIDEEGNVSYKTAKDKDLYYIDKNGKQKMRTQKATQMSLHNDAYELSSGSYVESYYAEYANAMKDYARRARVEMQKPELRLKYNPSAKETYAKEVSSLNAKLNIALKNAPLERRAQMLANSVVKAKSQADEELTKSEKKKLAQRELVSARTKTGAKRHPIDITDREWEAIQAGAISDSKLMSILNHTDTDKLRARATPRTTTQLSDAKVRRISAMASSGYTNAEIAQALGVSASTVTKYLNPKS